MGNKPPALSDEEHDSHSTIAREVEAEDREGCETFNHTHPQKQDFTKTMLRDGPDSSLDTYSSVNSLDNSTSYDQGQIISDDSSLDNDLPVSSDNSTAYDQEQAIADFLTRCSPDPRTDSPFPFDRSMDNSNDTLIEDTFETGAGNRTMAKSKSIMTSFNQEAIMEASNSSMETVNNERVDQEFGGTLNKGNEKLFMETSETTRDDTFTKNTSLEDFTTNEQEAVFLSSPGNNPDTTSDAPSWITSSTDSTSQSDKSPVDSSKAHHPDTRVESPLPMETLPVIDPRNEQIVSQTLPRGVEDTGPNGTSPDNTSKDTSIIYDQGQDDNGDLGKDTLDIDIRSLSAEISLEKACSQSNRDNSVGTRACSPSLSKGSSDFASHIIEESRSSPSMQGKTDTERSDCTSLVKTTSTHEEADPVSLMENDIHDRIGVESLSSVNSPTDDPTCDEINALENTNDVPSEEIDHNGPVESSTHCKEADSAFPLEDNAPDGSHSPADTIRADLLSLDNKSTLDSLNGKSSPVSSTGGDTPGFGYVDSLAVESTTDVQTYGEEIDLAPPPLDDDTLDDRPHSSSSSVKSLNNVPNVDEEGPMEVFASTPHTEADNSSIEFFQREGSDLASLMKEDSPSTKTDSLSSVHDPSTCIVLSNNDEAIIQTSLVAIKGSVDFPSPHANDEMDTTKHQEKAPSETLVNDGTGTHFNRVSMSTKNKKNRRWKREELDCLGVSVHYLQRSFLYEVRKANLNEEASMSDISEHGIIWQKGEQFHCPIDGKIGAAYIHSRLDPNDEYVTTNGIEEVEDVQVANIGDETCRETQNYKDTSHSVIVNEINTTNSDGAENSKGDHHIDIDDLECTDPKEDEDVVYHVGLANMILGYTWNCSIGQIIDVLVSYCTSYGLDLEQTYVWMSCLCTNQHRVTYERSRLGMSINCGNIEQTFVRRFTKIGHYLSIMSPWHSPDLITHVYPMYEMFMASKTGCKIIVVMTPREKSRFIQAIDGSSSSIKGSEGQLKKLSEVIITKTRIQNSKATVKSDLSTILRTIEDGPGYEHFNSTVNTIVRDWIVDLGLDEVENRRRMIDDGGDDDSNKAKSRLDFAGVLIRVGFLLQNIAESSLAAGLYREALIIYKSLYGRNHVYVATTLNNVAFAMRAEGNLDEALKIFREALEICECLYGRNHAHTATTLNNIGLILRTQGKLDEALEALTKALEIKKVLMGTNHADTARSLNNVAGLLRSQGKFHESLKLYQDALVVRKKLLGAKHPSSIATTKKIATLTKQLTPSN